MFRKSIELFVMCWLFCFMILAGCTPKEEIPATRVVAERTVTGTAVTTPIVHTTINPTRQIIPSPTPTTPVTATSIILPTATLVPLPLPPMPPFPTVTPDYPFYETKPIFLFYGAVGGDGGIPFGRNTPSLVIYGNGQLLMEVGDGQTRTVMESHLSPGEMCELREQIAATGFMEPHDPLEYYTQREDSDGAPETVIQIEDTFYSFYIPDMPYLVEDLRNGVAIIESFQPEQPLVPYAPERLFLWVEEWTPDDQIVPTVWPDEFPSLAELNISPLIEGELVMPVFDLVLSSDFFQEGETIYLILARPMLPHETLQNANDYPRPPRDYLPVIDCEGEPSLISPAIPTATPTLTTASAQLTGHGRILFVTNNDGDDEIYIMEADGSNRQRLTNNVADDSSPIWFPDGETIVFTSNRDGDNEIYVMAVDGTNVIQLTDNDTDDYATSISPDGEYIAFVSDRDNGWRESEIYIIRRDGSESQRLTHDTYRNLNPEWLRDGNNISFLQEVAFNELYKVVTLNIETLEMEAGSEIYNLLSNPLPILSPGGSYFAWNKLVDDSNSIVQIMDNAGVLQREINIPSRRISSLDWSSDERFIIFSAREADDWDMELYVLIVDKGEITQITHNQQDEFSATWWP